MATVTVTVGMPVYNGARTLARAIDSVLAQTHQDFELVISDNASTDATASILAEYAARDPRVRVIRQPTNIGGKRNFVFVSEQANTPLFMWLGHDDWIDPAYLERCVPQIRDDSSYSLVAGLPRYYKDGKPAYTGVTLQATDPTPAARIVSYLRQVADNGVFYGVMRTADIRRIQFPDMLGADWMIVASLAFLGKIATVPEVSVHRDIGGTSRSYQRQVEVLELPPWNARFPMTAISSASFNYLLREAEVMRDLSTPVRLVIAAEAAWAIAYRALRVEAYARLTSRGRLKRRRRAASPGTSGPS